MQCRKSPVISYSSSITRDIRPPLLTIASNLLLLPAAAGSGTAVVAARRCRRHSGATPGQLRRSWNAVYQIF